MPAPYPADDGGPLGTEDWATACGRFDRWPPAYPGIKGVEFVRRHPRWGTAARDAKGWICAPAAASARNWARASGVGVFGGFG